LIDPEGYLDQFFTKLLNLKEINTLNSHLVNFTNKSVLNLSRVVIKPKVTKNFTITLVRVFENNQQIESLAVENRHLIRLLKL